MCVNTEPPIPSGAGACGALETVASSAGADYLGLKLWLPAEFPTYEEPLLHTPSP